ncbi:MAG: endolytic transglycosylase MltG [Eubacterium sp.]|nr:endolytic transglycosylase MltG [Eubacterium sp.]
MAKKNKNGAVIAVLLIILIAVVGGFSFKIYSSVSDDINGKNQPKTEYTLVIEKSDFEAEVASKLAGAGIIQNAVVWQNWMSSKYPDFVYINGEYTLTADMSYEQLAEKLQNPDVSHKTVKVAIPEGYNVMQIAETLEENGICKADEFLEKCKSSDGYDYEWLNEIPDNKLIAYRLEGFLFPATYDLPQNCEPENVIIAMLDAFDDNYTNAMREYCEKNYMTLYELITLASVVQEEAFDNTSAEMVASVFINRLNINMKLQSNVTRYYARKLYNEQGFSKKTYDYYDTYTCSGLPAGPITNSGASIINAVINAPETDYLFFFTDIYKEFHFSKTFEEHSELLEKYPYKEEG